MAQSAYEMDIDTFALLRNTFGQEHPAVLASQVNLAQDLQALNRVQETDKIQAAVVRSLRKVLGNQHPATVSATRDVRFDGDIDPMPL